MKDIIDDSPFPMNLPKSLETKMYQRIDTVLHRWEKFEKERGCVFPDNSAMSLGEDSMYYYHPMENNKVLIVTLPTDGGDYSVRIDRY